MYNTQREIIEKVQNIQNDNEVFIKGTRETPEVHLSKSQSKISFFGRSLPENAKEFYNPIKDWIDKYVQNINSTSKETEVIFKFEYFNTSSSKMIMEILMLIKKLQEKQPKLNVYWKYLEDDEDMIEAGEDYENITGVEFQYAEYI